MCPFYSLLCFDIGEIKTLQNNRLKGQPAKRFEVQVFKFKAYSV